MPAARPSPLDALGAVAREAVERRLRAHRYGRGQVVFREGDPADCLHLVRSGHLDLRRTSGDGQVLTVRVLGPGAAAGETALVAQGVRRTGTLVALDRAETATLSRRDFDPLRREHPSVERLVVEALVAGEAERDALLVDLLLAAPDRVWRRLAVLAELYGDGPVAVTQEVLAHMAGTSRQTANRVLGEAARDGLVAVHRAHLEVLDPAGLRARADGEAPARPRGGPGR